MEGGKGREGEEEGMERGEGKGREGEWNGGKGRKEEGKGGRGGAGKGAALQNHPHQQQQTTNK